MSGPKLLKSSEPDAVETPETDPYYVPSDKPDVTNKDRQSPPTVNLPFKKAMKTLNAFDYIAIKRATGVEFHEAGMAATHVVAWVYENRGKSSAERVPWSGPDGVGSWDSQRAFDYFADPESDKDPESEVGKA